LFNAEDSYLFTSLFYRPILEEDGTVEDRENGNAAVLRGL
jgi:hypothetical protein